MTPALGLIFAFLSCYIVDGAKNVRVSQDANRQHQAERVAGSSVRQLQGCGGNQIPFEVQLLTDEAGYETYWSLVDSSDRVILEGGSPEVLDPNMVPELLAGREAALEPATEYRADTCLNRNEDYVFTIWDFNADGICCRFGVGSVVVFVDGDEYWSGGVFEGQEIVPIGRGITAPPVTPPSVSPVDPVGPSTLPLVEDGSFDECGNDYRFFLELPTDAYPEENAWSITVQGTGRVVEESEILQASSLYRIRRCLPRNTNYILTISDEFGDGIGGNNAFEYIVDFNGAGDNIDITRPTARLGHGSIINLQTGNISPVIVEPEVTVIEDGSFQRCNNDQYQVLFEVLTDDFPGETSWEITNRETGDIVFESIDPNAEYINMTNTLYEIRRCLPRSENYVLSIFDSFEDGIQAPGYFRVTLDNDSFDGNRDFGEVTRVSIPELRNYVPPNAPNAVINDGSFDNCANNEYQFLVALNTDRFPAETSWDIVRTDNGAVVDDSSRSNAVEFFEAERRYRIRRCLPKNREYIFTLYDSWGDGLCCDASFRVELDGQRFDPSKEFTYSQSIHIPDLTLVDGDDVGDDVVITDGPFTDCANNQFELLIVLHTDFFPNETSWNITNRGGAQAVVFSSEDPESIIQPFQANTTYEIRRCLNNNREYIFNINDSYGDGLCCDAFYQLRIPNNRLGNNRLNSDAQFQFFESVNVPELTPVVPTYQDGNFNNCNNNDYQFLARLRTDMYPDETSWMITDAQNDDVVFASSQNRAISEFEPESLYEIRRCLPNNRNYVFHILDTYGDGLCCGGEYELILDDDERYSSNGDFTFRQMVNIPSMRRRAPRTEDGQFNGCDQNDFYRVLITLDTDVYPTELSWDINRLNNNDRLGAVETSSSERGAINVFEEPETKYEIRRCLPKNNDYAFTLYDSYGDGLCCDGQYTVQVDGQVFEPEEPFTFSQTIHIPDPRIIYPNRVLDGDFDNCRNNEYEVLVEIMTDEFPEETSWIIRNAETGEAVFASTDNGAARINRAKTMYEIRRCLPRNDEFTLTIMDSFGDGLLTDEAYYRVEVDQVQDFVSDGNFEVSESVSIPDFHIAAPIILDGSHQGCNANRNHQLTAIIFADEYPTEIAWEITKRGTGEVLFASWDANAEPIVDEGAQIQIRRCLPIDQDQQYLFTIKDNFGDGLVEPGHFIVQLDDDEVYYGDGTYGFKESIVIPDLTRVETNRRDGDFSECRNQNNEYQFYAAITTDTFGYETSWNITDLATGDVVFASADADAISHFDPDETYEIRRCLPRNRNYAFNINDSFGDGICCGMLRQNRYGYKIEYNGRGQPLDLNRGGNFGGSERINLQTGDVIGPGTCRTAHEFQLDLHTDVAPDQISWELRDLSTNNDRVIASHDGYTQTKQYYQELSCLSSDGPFLFTIFDEKENGFAFEGSYSVVYDGNVVGSGHTYSDSESVLFGEFANQNQFEDLCDEYDGLPFVLDLTTDRHPEETSWNLVDSKGFIVSDVKSYSRRQRNVREYRCIRPLSNKDPYYDYTINDSASDGICCSPDLGNGRYSLRFNGDVYFRSTGEFGQSETTRYQEFEYF